MLVKHIMSVPPARIRHSSHLHHAAEIVALSKVSDLMVVDDDNNFLGVLSEGDILRAALPDFDEIGRVGGTLEGAFEVFLRKGAALSDRPIMPLVIQDPIVVALHDHVAAVTVIMVDKAIRSLPVVDNGKLAGTVSRSDVCRAVVGTL